MKNLQKENQKKKLRRVARVRAKVYGTAARPRLAVFRSIRFISAQLIDDHAHKTLVAASDRDLKEKIDAGERKALCARAYATGRLIAKKAKEKNIFAVVFDRRSYQYHGRVAALAEGARDGGLKF